MASVNADLPAEVPVFTVRPQFRRAWLARASALFYVPVVLLLAIEVPAHAALLPFALPHWPWLLGAVGVSALIAGSGLFRAWVTVHFRCYDITDHRVIVRVGGLTNTSESIFLRRLDDVIVRRDLLDRLCGTGTLWLRDPDGGMMLHWVAHPDTVQSLIVRSLPGYTTTPPLTFWSETAPPASRRRGARCTWRAYYQPMWRHGMC